MSKQIIDIGVQGNDGTGDSIRESFRKVNDNFTELYAVFGVEGTIGLSSLSDGPASYDANQVIMSSNSGENLTARTIVGSGAISINTANDGQIVISAQTTGLGNDPNPRLANHLNANNLTLVRLADPSQSIVDVWNLNNPSAQTTLNQLPVTKGFADSNYLKVTGERVGSILRIREEPSVPDFSDPDYDSTLVGNYTATEAVQRKFAVSRKGDSMSGPLFLHDHPTPLENYGTPNGVTDLQAASKFYVDNSTFSSAVNLYVSAATGDDLQQRSPVGREGRFWQYAYKSLGAAALAAENLISLSTQEPGPYRQRLSYTIGPDQIFSTIKSVTLLDGNTAVAGYQDAFDLLQINKEFIQAETIAYINNKYVNRFIYDRVEFQEEIAEILSGVGYDIVLDSTYNVTRIGTKYLTENTTEELSTRLIQLVEAIKFARDEVIGFQYSDTALGIYIGNVIDAICYDLVLLTNYQSIQAGLNFAAAGTALTPSQIVQVLIDLEDQLLDLPEITNFTTAKDLISSNIETIVNIVTGDNIASPIFTSQPDQSVGSNSARDLLLENIAFLQAEAVAYLGAEYPSLSYDKVARRRDIQYIVWSLIYDFMYGGNSQSVYTGLRYWDGLTRTINEYEVEPLLDVLTYLSSVIVDVVRSDSPQVTYQTSVRQYRNETLIQGEVTISSLEQNIQYLKDIIDDKTTPTVVFPAFSSSANLLKLARIAILDEKTDFQTNAVIFVEGDGNILGNFPVINDQGVLEEITEKFQVLIDLLNTGIDSRELPAYTAPSGTVAGRVSAKELAVLNLDFIADEAWGYLGVQHSEFRSTFDEDVFKRIIKDAVEASIYDLFYSGNSASQRVGLVLLEKGLTATQLLDAFEKAGSILTLSVITNTEPLISYSSTPQYINSGLYPGGSIAASALNLSFNAISIIISGETIPDVVTPDSSASWSNYDVDLRTAKDIIDLNTDGGINIPVLTTNFLDTNYLGGFNYDESICYRDVGLIIEAMMIDLRTGGTYQSINAGKSYYRNASAKAVAIGTQYRETVDGIEFTKDLALQVLRQETASRFQTLVTQTFNPAKVVTQGAITDFTNNMNTVIDIINGGISVAPTPTFGTGLWNVEIDNGGNGYVDQGAPGNNDIIPAKVLVGLASGAYANIVKYIPGSSSTSDTIQVRLTKPGFFQLGEEIEFGETVRDINIVIQVESGIYYEDYPIRLPANVSVRGDEFRRTIIRPRDRVSQSPWRKVFFYRDSVIDALELGLIDTTNDYSVDSSILLSGVNNRIVITLGTGQVPGAWVGKILMDDRPSINVISTSSTGNLITTDGGHDFSVGNPVVFTESIGGLTAGKIYYVLTTSEDGTSFTLSPSITSTTTVTVTSDTGTETTKVLRNDRRGKAIVDSVSGNFMNCSVIYPFQSNGVVEAGGWHLYDPINYGRHYLTDPLDVNSPAKNNKDIDVLLTNDANRVSNLTFQGHGGFAMVLDPEGQIKTKSPYGQVCSSFSQSNNRKRFAGGQFVDGFAGRLRGTVTAVEYDGIEGYDLTSLVPGSDYIPASSTVTYTNVPMIGITRTVSASSAVDNTFTVNSITDLFVGGGITFSGTVFGGIESGRLYYITSVEAIVNKITISTTQGGEELVLSTASGSMTATTGGRGATANVTVTNGLVTNVIAHSPGEYYKAGEFLTVDSQDVGGAGSGFKISVLSVSGKGIKVTIVGGANSGLDIRPPQPPCAFFVQGNRYQIDDVAFFDASTGTVIVTLDRGTPYNLAGSYDNEICSRDVGLIIDSVLYDLVLGSNYQTVKAGLSYTRATASTVITSQSQQTLAGLNYVRSQVISLEDIADAEYDEAKDAINTSMSIVNTIIEQSVGSAPLLSYPDVAGISTVNSGKVRDNLVANREFITTEITAWIASTFSLRNFPTYSAVKSRRDMGYIIDAMIYDIMYGGNSMTYDAALAYYSFGVSYIPGVQSICIAAVERLTSIVQQVLLNETIAKSAGNIESQVINSGYLITSGDSEYTKVETLTDLISDYIFDGDFDTPTTRTPPTIVGLDADKLFVRSTVLDAKDSIRADTIEYLNDGGGLVINIEMGGNKSMLANDFAMINDLGYAIVCTNGGVSEQVSTFTYYCHTHYWANNGGQIRSVAGSNAHGVYGLRSSGFDVTEKPDSVNLAYDMVQVARVYKQGQFATEMTPTATKQSLAVYILGYDYTPTNISELEIDHTVAGIPITRYEVTSIERTVVTLNGQNVLKLNLSTAGSNGTSSVGLAATLYDGQQVTIRALQNVKFNNIDNVRPTRPSTALQYNDNLADIYRILAYNLNESTGELLADNIAILQSDSSFNYYKFITDINNIGSVDYDVALTITGASGNGSTVTVSFATQDTAPFVVGDFITVQDVVNTGGANSREYNGAYRVTNCTDSTVEFSSTVTSTYASGGLVSDKTQGSRAGDTKVAVLEISQETTINQVNKGTYLLGWHGRTHRVSGYTTPLKIAQGSVVTWTAGTKTLVLSAVSGAIDAGDILTGTGWDGTQQVVSVILPEGAVTTFTVVVDTLPSTTPTGVITFGVEKNGWLNIDPNPISNILGDASTIPAIGYVSKLVPESGKKFATYDIPWDPDALPVVDNSYKFAGQSNANYNYWKQVVGAVSATTISTADVTGLTVGMIVTSVSAGAFVPEGTIIQSINSSNNTFTVAPACWVPAGAAVSSTVVATVTDVIITNNGNGYTSGAPILSFVGGDPIVPAIATCTVLNGSIDTVTVVSPGYGYTSIPTIEVSYGNAVFTAVLSATATVNTVATNGDTVNRITVAYDSDPGVFNRQDYVEFTATISNGSGDAGTILNVASVATGTLKVGQTITGSGISAGTRITALGTGSGGAGTYTVNDSQNILSIDMVARVLTTTATSPVGPATFTGSISGTTMSVVSGLSGTIAVGQLVRGTGVLAGTYITAGSGSTWTVNRSQIVTSTALSTTFAVTISFATQSTAATTNVWYRVSGNTNSLYNGIYFCLASTTSSVTLGYLYDPGVWSTETSVVLERVSGTATSSAIGISKPFDPLASATLRLGYARETAAQITTRISTCRATGHDFLDIGTGSYSTTNYPYQIYGNPTQSRQQANEVVEDGVGRVFYVTSDQNGIFRVGRYFTVDQGTGTVTFSASIALSNLDGLGFKRGVVISEFSTDTSMTNNAPEVVPVQSAVRGYIDKRLGLDHGGGPVSANNLIGPGYLPLNGSLTMKGSLNMGTFAITNVGTPLPSSDGRVAANKAYVDQEIGNFDEISELRDTSINSISAGDILVYDQTNTVTIVGGLATGAAITLNFLTQASAPFPIGSVITVSGVNPSSYNGTYIVTGCTTTSVTYASDVITGYNNGGTVVQNRWRNINLPVDVSTNDVLLTYNGATGKVTSAIQANKIVNSMVSTTAGIVQSKLTLNAAGLIAAGAGDTAPTVTQADLGLAAFRTSEFNSNSGWISLKTATDTVTGVRHSKLQWMSQGTVIGRGLTAGTGAAGEISFSDIVTGGDGIKNAPFTSVGAMTVSGVGPNSYIVTPITVTGVANSLVKTDSSGNLAINNGSINAVALKISTNQVINVDTASNTVQYYTPGQFVYSKSVGTSSLNTLTTMYGTVFVDGTLRSTTLTTGAAATAGTLTGNWSASSNSTIDVRNGTLRSTTLSTGSDTDTGTIQGYWSLVGSSRLEATYADLAEYYEGDNEYRPGMVLVFGGEKEVTTTTTMNDTRVAGVVTTNPAYVMNNEQKGIKICIALAGRVPCWVVGRVKKGDLLTTATTLGCAMKANTPTLGSIVGKALEDKDFSEAGIIQIAVGRA